MLGMRRRNNARTPKAPTTNTRSSSAPLCGASWCSSTPAAFCQAVRYRRWHSRWPLDPAMGLHHADKPGRDFFALDLGEILRPQVDRFVLDLLCTNGPMRYLSATLFAEEPDGTCRPVPPITHLLAEQAVYWAQHVAPHADHVARVLARIGNGEIARSTRITDEGQPAKIGPRRKPAQPLRLSEEVTVERIIPDDLWAILGPIVITDTPRPRTGHPARDNRAALAGIVCAQHLGCSREKRDQHCLTRH